MGGNTIMIDIVGHFAYLILFYGLYLITQKKKSGFVLQIIGALIWCALGIILGLTSIIIWNIGFICVNLYGFSKWN